MRFNFFAQALVAAVIYLAASGCTTATVYIARHAEKVDETDSTDLSKVGFDRAAALADTLAKQGIDSIFTTPFRRTRQTAEPLAQRIGVGIATYPAQPTQRLIERLQRIKNKNVLVIGHSNTILDITKGLGTQPSITKIQSGDYDNLLMVQIKRRPFGKSVRLTERTYGQATAP